MTAKHVRSSDEPEPVDRDETAAPPGGPDDARPAPSERDQRWSDELSEHWHGAAASEATRRRSDAAPDQDSED